MHEAGRLDPITRSSRIKLELTFPKLMSFRQTIVAQLRLKPHNKPRKLPHPEERWAMDTMTRSEAAVTLIDVGTFGSS